MESPIAKTFDHIEAAVTICDADFTILYMNEKAGKAFEAQGGLNLVGTNLGSCHKPESVEKLRGILGSARPNVYTISKNGVKKLIWQGPWEKDGKISGLVEISIPLPDFIPHYDRG
jgi:hypothetical protein